MKFKVCFSTVRIKSIFGGESGDFGRSIIWSSISSNITVRIYCVECGQLVV